jgi:DNA polymerase-3 subunit gamma/tau
MAESPHDAESPVAKPPSRASYVVIARRYRPQLFTELVGQEHVAQALSNAIAAGRVGHAYLFTGARGVGKTSAARILAKALNCVTGPTPAPCNRCDICLSTSTGEDVDVLEIDGASNRGIEEIRQLRQNVSIRPSRARFKIYIIDEVHMLTREAFNALLKTLEEPPGHVKFIFCTTEASKIPVTILSRCQRFDFAGISWPAIAERLKQIVAAEGLAAEEKALELLARRAAGSMRDGQSLLEQLLAFAEGRITVADVHAMLGTAGTERLGALASRLFARDAAGVLNELDATLREGVDAGQLLEQIFGYFRDTMLAALGSPPDCALYADPADWPAMAAAGKRLGQNTLLAAMQIVEQTLARLRYSIHPRPLVELALVRICQLEELDELAEVIAMLRSGNISLPGSGGLPGGAASTGGAGVPGGKGLAAGAPGGLSPSNPAVSPPPAIATPPSESAGASGTGFRAAAMPSAASTAVSSAASAALLSAAVPATAEVVTAPATADPPATPVDSTTAAPTPSAPTASSTSAPSPANASLALNEENALALWRQAIEHLGGMMAEQARHCEQVHFVGPNRLVVFFRPEYAVFKGACERPEQLVRFERALTRLAGRPIHVMFRLVEDAGGGRAVEEQRRSVSPQQRWQKVAKHPLVQRAGELFNAQPIRIEETESKED